MGLVVFKKFWERVNKNGPNGCWEWMGARHTFGHGSVYIGRRSDGRSISVLAHRFSYSIFNKDLCSHRLVCHKCDNPCCVNPDHLFLGTHKDNTQDMLRKGRGRYNPVRGEKTAKAKLKNEDIPKIRADPRSQRAIAAEYGVNHKLICDIKRRRLWSHIP